MKITCYGTCVLLIVILTSQQVLGDYWSIWTEWSECSRTCDGGATYQLRRCVRSRRFARGCEGDNIRYSTCNNKPCSPEANDFRTQQCAAHNDEIHIGTYLKWIPYHDSTSPCALYCRAIGSNRIKKFAPKVLDGTRCRQNALDMCINGKCWPVGCDNVLGSQVKPDRCGICGGNNTCLVQQTNGRYIWISLGYGLCSATCGVGYQESKITCQDKVTGELVASKRCRALSKPNRYRRKCVSRKCEPSWSVGPWHECTQTCGGGHAWRTVICVDTYLDGTQRLVDDKECKGHQPSNRKSCSNHLCPTWYAGEWTPCSVSCGSGNQVREVVCRHVGEDFCNLDKKPATLKNCSTYIPCLEKADALYAEIDHKADIQEVMIGHQSDKPQKLEVIYDDEVEGEDLENPRFVVSRWSACSSTCGRGVKSRYVRCKVYLPFLESIVDLPNIECKDTTKPTETQDCYMDPCFDHYEYRSIGLTACTRTCLGGVQETVLKCVHKSNGSIVPVRLCSEAQPLPIERRVCNDFPCPQRWQIGDFGSCSQTCGRGMMSRDVVCIQEFSEGEQNILNLPDFMCEQPVPQRERPCNRIDCPSTWFTGNWSQCSVTCGGGVLSRDVLCRKTLANGDKLNVSFTECGNLNQPERYRECNKSACPQPEIRQMDVKFFQLNKIKKIRLSMGMVASVLPGTTVIVKCATKGVDRRRIMWYKDGHHIIMGTRIKLTHGYALKIKKSRPGEDQGIYTCKVAAIQASLTLNFNTVYDVFQATVLRQRYLSDPPPGVNPINTTGTKKDPIDRNIKTLQIVKTRWSDCSATCGGGLQARNISCEIITSDYYLTFPVRFCTKSRFREPTQVQSCNHIPCAYWKIGDWSQCSVGACYRNMFSMQYRSVDCVTEAGEESVNATYCSYLGAVPYKRKECVNINCTAQWNTSEWSQCMGPCGGSGFKARMLSCIWSATGLPANSNCESLRRPRTRRGCRTSSCTDCKDQSKHCSIVKLMKLCRHKTFQTQCCKSCS